MKTPQQRHWPATLLKRDFNIKFPYEIREILKNTYFEEHLRTAAFASLQKSEKQSFPHVLSRYRSSTLT